MKKFASVILALAFMLSLSVPAFAAGPGEKIEVGFTYEVSEPKFTVEIPAGIELVLGGTVDLPVTVSGGATETLDGRKIAITLEDAAVGDIKTFFPDGVEPGESSAYDDFLVVRNDSAPAGYYKTLMYDIRGEISNSDATHGPPYSGNIAGFLISGWKFFEFTEDGTKNLRFRLWSTHGMRDSEDNTVWFNASKVYPNSKYTGWIVFGVKIVD
ncbi:MAG: hypothetical protein FWF18_00405 [Dehalococcoidia bacterium]|nr:hypothetical protein [Dehalococcoidia bacterium]